MGVPFPKRSREKQNRLAVSKKPDVCFSRWRPILKNGQLSFADGHQHLVAAGNPVDRRQEIGFWDHESRDVGNPDK